MHTHTHTHRFQPGLRALQLNPAELHHANSNNLGVLVSYPDERPVEDVEDEKGDGENDAAALIDPLSDFLGRHGRESVELGESRAPLEGFGRCRGRRRITVDRHHAADRVVLLVVYLHRRHVYSAREALHKLRMLY